jgi:hypothetical protein
MDYSEVDFGLKKDIVIGETTDVCLKIQGIVKCEWTLPGGKKVNSLKFSEKFNVKPGVHQIKFTAELFNGMKLSQVSDVYFRHPFGSDVNTTLDGKLHTVAVTGGCKRPG